MKKTMPNEGHKGVSPEWANLPRRKCDDCGTWYKPKRPLLKDTRGFCSDNCRKSYHKHGGAYRKLKGEMVKMVERHLEEDRTRLRQIVREELADYANGKYTSSGIMKQ